MDKRETNKLRLENTGHISEKKWQEIMALFNDADKEFEVKEILYEEISSLVEEEIKEPDFQILFEKLWSQIKKKQKHQNKYRKLVVNVSKIAAVLIIGALIGVFTAKYTSNNDDTLSSYFAAHSPKGSISELVMPDSTIIFLNADSKIKYVSNVDKNGKREVFLEGEAWFDVMKNQDRPFVVHTSYYDVQVTGTQFNIKAYEADNRIATTLEKGEVIIKSNNKGGLKIEEEVILNPGEQAVLNKDTKTMNIESVNTRWYTSWKDNKLIFVNMDLEDLIILLERKYGVDIEVTNQDILHLHFDGTLKDESIIEFLEIVKKTLPISYEIVGQKIEISN